MFNDWLYNDWTPSFIMPHLDDYEFTFQERSQSAPMSMGESYRPRETHEFFKNVPDPIVDLNEIKNSIVDLNEIKNSNYLEEFDSFYSGYGYGVQAFDEPMIDAEYYNGVYELPENVTKIKSNKRSGGSRLSDEDRMERDMLKAQERDEREAFRAYQREQREAERERRKREREEKEEKMHDMMGIRMARDAFNKLGSSFDDVSQAGIGFLSKF